MTSSSTTSSGVAGRTDRPRIADGRMLVAVGVATLVVVAAVAVVGPMVSPYAFDSQDHSAILKPPSLQHWSGTARLGEDVLTQTMHGLRKSLVIGILAAVVSTAVAAVVGAFAGYLGGRVDSATLWTVDMLLTIPSVLVVAVLSPLFVDRSWLWLAVAVAALGWMLQARVIRARALVLRVSGYVRASRSMGASAWHVMRVHLIPNMFALLTVDCALGVATAIIAEAGLSYFGFGVQAPDVSLGTLLATGSNSAVTYPWTFLAPAAALVITVLAVGFVGEGARRRFEGEAR